MKLSRKRICLCAATLLFLIGMLAAAVYLKSVAGYQKAVKETAFYGIDISNIPDGIYAGEYDVNFLSARVKVTVLNGAITNIVILEHKNERGKPAEIVADRIIREQKMDVDTVSDATNSSIVIKKAIENALTGEEFHSNPLKKSEISD
ncbi:MAG: FMN-binding protein [Eubacterium sp.]|nr:FMN-binding protein [Eubacterium sp.]